jgi:hypothetical protein
VDLSWLDAAVRTSCGLSLAELLETVFGRPLSDRPAEEVARAERFRVAEESPLYASADWLRDWAGARGRPTRLVMRAGTHVLADAVAILERLESSTGTVGLTTLVSGETVADRLLADLGGGS